MASETLVNTERMFIGGLQNLNAAYFAYRFIYHAKISYAGGAFVMREGKIITNFHIILAK